MSTNSQRREKRDLTAYKHNSSIKVQGIHSHSSKHKEMNEKHKYTKIPPQILKQ